jgi:hypothetical protein
MVSHTATKNEFFPTSTATEQRGLAPPNSRSSAYLSAHNRANIYSKSDDFIAPASYYNLTADASDAGSSDSDRELSADESDSHDMSPPSVPLYPFQNQVGGHTSLLRFSDKAICKPLIQSEKDFYEFIENNNHELIPFISVYLGVLNVTFDVSSGQAVPQVLFDKNQHLLPNHLIKRFCSGSPKNKKCIFIPSPNNSPPGVTKINKKLQEQIFQEACSPSSLRARYKALNHYSQFSPPLTSSRRRHSLSDKQHNSSPVMKVQSNESRLASSFSGSYPNLSGFKNDSQMDYDVDTIHLPSQRVAVELVPVLSLNDDHSLEMFEMEDLPPPAPTSPPYTEDTNIVSNPWSLECYNSIMSKMADLSCDQPHKFLLLGDLTYNIQRPCVLDLKMGTRQYGIYASKEKRDSQLRKCEKSTSKNLGVRVCGMQIYKSDQEKFIFQDKYYGRKLNPTSFKKTIVDYLDNGCQLNIQFIPPLVQKLRKLFDTVRTMNGYRFYSSSLLLIYDGAARGPTNIELKMIDFTNCVHPQMYQNLDKDAPVPTFPPSTSGPDHGYLRGIVTLLEVFTQIWNMYASEEEKELYQDQMILEDHFPDAY